MDRDELRTRRLQLGLSQTELADLLGVHLMTVSKWERGVNPIPASVPPTLQTIEAGGVLRRRLGRRLRLVRSGAAIPAMTR
jgi:DNA-binding transcriptional regulator YiaG